MFDSLQTISKALAAFIGGALVTFALKKGVVLDESTSLAVTTVIAGLFNALIVYVAPRNK